MSDHVKDIIAWSKIQKKLLKSHLKETFESEGKFYELLLDEQKRILLDKNAKIMLDGDRLTVTMKQSTYSVHLDQMSGVALTQQNKISFDEGNKTYLMKMKHSMLFFDLINMKKGDLS